MSSDIEKTIAAIARDVAQKHATQVDQQGEFPAATLSALREAGLFGLVSAKEVGGTGGGLREAVTVVESLARECSSSAMVTCMHYVATVVIENLGDPGTRREIAAGKHLTTLAFSEMGSRGQFWAPVSSATKRDGKVGLTAKKSWVTSAHHAQSYVWSSKPLAAAGASTLWLVPSQTPGLRVAERFEGLGLRGNDSCPITAEDVRIDEERRLGEDGTGFDIMLGMVLPWFNVLNAACSVGLMESATARTAAHVTGTHFEHDGTRLADLPTVRAYVARMRIKTDMARALLADAVTAIESGRADAVLRVLESKAAAADTAAEVMDLAMRVCGGAAFRHEVGVERNFRDARAAMVMAPTSDVLFDFIGKASLGLPLF
ncbi:MAG: acyl-CoA dehydrogenase family protein [Polyangiaceae bacterium]